MPIKNYLADRQPEMAAWRQDLHQHPELMFDTVRTAQMVADKLRAFGCDQVVTGLAQNGVVAVIHGKQNSSGRVVGLRADMDALPIHEATGVTYASATEGKMHACGHDGHTTMLLGAAQYLAGTRHFDGQVALIFQPAEEGGGGGRVMCEEGLMQDFNIQEVYGMHNMPGIPVGEFAIRAGAFFAAADQFTLQLRGRGGHAAMPNKAIDSTLVASHIVVALQSIASRNVDPLKQVVVSVCTFITESEAHNVIPEHVLLKGTVRTLDAETQDLTENRLRTIVTSVAEAFGATVEIDYERSYPTMVNSPAETQFAAEIGQRISGKPTAEVPPIMGGEDFAFMLQERPGAYILVGNGDTADLHHPGYDFSDSAIPYGASYWAELVERRLATT